MLWESGLVITLDFSPKLQTGLRKKAVTVPSGSSAFRGTSEILQLICFTPFWALLYSVLSPSSGRASLSGGKRVARSSVFTLWPWSSPSKKVFVPSSSSRSPVLESHFLWLSWLSSSSNQTLWPGGYVRLWLPRPALMPVSGAGGGFFPTHTIWTELGTGWFSMINQGTVARKGDRRPFPM